MCKWSINPITNPNPVYSHTHTRDNTNILFPEGYSIRSCNAVYLRESPLIWRNIPPPSSRSKNNLSLLPASPGFLRLRWRRLVSPKYRAASQLHGVTTQKTTLFIVTAYSRWLPTAVARVRAQVRSCGVCGGQSGTWACFLEYFGFPCQLLFHRLLHIHHLSSGAGTIGQLVADVPSGLSPTPPQETKKKKNKSPPWNPEI
jgi:hypothetical protein